MKEKLKALFKSKYFWFSGAGGSFLLLLLLFFLSTRLLESIKKQIQQKAESVLPTHQIKIGKISTNFLTNIALSSIELSHAGGFANGTLFKAEKIKVRIQIWKLLTTRLAAHRDNLTDSSTPFSAGEGSLSIQIQKPALSLLRKNGEWLKPNIKKGERPLLPMQVQWFDGTASVEDSDSRWKELNFQNWSGSLEMAMPVVSLQTSLQSEKNEKFNLSGKVDIEKNCSAKISASNLQIREALLFLTTAPKNLSFTGGLNSDIEIQGKLPLFSTLPANSLETLAWLKNWKISGKLRPENLTLHWRKENSTTSIQAEGEIRFSQNQVETSEFKFATPHSELKISGSVLSLLTTPQIQSHLRANFLIGEWVAKDAGGKGEISINLSGEFKNLDATGSIKISQGDLFASPFSLESKIVVQKGRGNLETFMANLAGGKVFGRGSVQKGKMEMDFRFSNINLAGMSQPERPLAGKLTAQLALRGEPAKPKLSGKISLKNFVWKKERFGNLNGSITLEKEFLDFKCASSDRRNRLNLLVKGWGKNLQSAKAFLVLAENQKANLTLAVQTTTKKLTGKLEASNFSVPLLSILSDRFSHFQGALSANGNISGTSENPVFNGKLRCPNLLVQAEVEGQKIHSEPHQFQSDLRWEKSFFELSNIRIAHSKWVAHSEWVGSSYQGSFRYFVKPISSFSLQAKVKDGDPKILFALVNVPQDISGKLQGEFMLAHKKNPDLNKNEAPWEGKGEVKISGGEGAQWGTIPFEEIHLKYESTQERVNLQQFLIKQKEGSLVASGNAAQREAENPLQLKAQTRNFLVAGNILNGDFTGEGKFVILPEEMLSTEIRSKNFSYNHLQSGALEGKIELVREHLLFNNFSWGNAFHGSGKLQFGQNGSPKISARWSSQMQKMEEWSKFFRSKLLGASGKMALSGTVSGTIAAMEHSLQAAFSDFAFSQSDNGTTALSSPSRNQHAATGGGQEGLEGTASGNFSKGILKSLKARLQTKTGGRLSLVGQANLNSKLLEIETTFSRLDARNFAGAITGNRLRGKARGQLTIQGAWSDPVIKGEVIGTQGAWEELPLDLWEIAGTFRQKEIQLTRLNFVGRKQSWRFSILEESWLKLQEGGESGAFNLAADFANLTIGPVSLVGAARTEGTWKKVPGSDVPLFAGNFKLNECLANNVELAAVTLQYQLHDKNLKMFPPPTPASETMNKAGASRAQELRVSGEIEFGESPCIHFKNLMVLKGEKRIFRLNGRVCPEKPSFQMEGEELNASLISGLLELPGTLSGNSRIKLTGTTQQNQSQVIGEFSLTNGALETVPIDSLRTNFEWKNGLFQLSRMDASLKGIYQLSAKGSFPLGWGSVKPPHQRVDVSATFSNSDLAILNFLKSDLIKKGKGPFSASLAWKGKSGSPTLSGTIELKNCELDSLYLPRNLTGFDLKIKMDSNQLSIEKGEGKIGGGKIKLEGGMQTIFEGGELFFDNFNLAFATLAKERIPVQVPELPVGRKKFGIPTIPSRGTPAFSLKLTGKREIPNISGWIELEDTLFSYPPAKKSKKDLTLFQNMDWDLKLKTGRKTIFQNDYVHSKIEGEIEFKGEKIQGKVRSKEGSLSLFGTKFDLKEANFEIAPTAPLSPAPGESVRKEIRNISYLQFKAERNVEVVTAGGVKVPDTIAVELERTPLTEEFDPSKIKFRSSHNPNLSSEKAASRAGVGINLEGLPPEEKDLELRKGIARILDSELVSPLARTIVQRTKLVDKIELVEDPGAGRAQELRGTEQSIIDPLIGQSILLEKTLIGRLGIGYSATFDKIRDRLDFIHRVQLRYPFYKGFQLYGATELEAKESLGREPETKGGVRWETKFDPSELFGKKKKKEEKGPVAQ